jgi:hypothetical protein
MDSDEQSMRPGTRRRVLDRLAVHAADPTMSLGRALCATSVDVLDVAGAGISLHPTADSYTVAVSNAVMAHLHELERSLGEGPCIDAYRDGQTVSAPDLADSTDGRWLAFTAAAARTEARASFGYPLHVGTARLGALNLYATRPGPLTDVQHGDAIVVADMITQALLTHPDAALPGTSLERLDDPQTSQLQVHQALGMIAVQLSSTIPDALARLRAHAYAEDRSISAVAADVVARRIRFQR